MFLVLLHRTPGKNKGRLRNDELEGITERKLRSSRRGERCGVVAKGAARQATRQAIETHRVAEVEYLPAEAEELGFGDLERFRQTGIRTEVSIPAEIVSLASLARVRRRSSGLPAAIDPVI
jgi:hypothetical protein